MGLSAFAVLLAIAWLVALPPQRRDVCLSADGLTDLCYCEALHDGWIRQPINTFSSFVFPIAGLAMLWHRRPAVTDRARSLFAREPRIRLVWAVTCILLGPASMVFHATFRMLPGLFDDLAMLFWLSLFASFHVGRVRGWSGSRVLTAFASMTLVFFGVALLSLVIAPEVNGPHAVTMVAAGAALLSPLMAYFELGSPGFRSERWLLGAVACFGVGFWTFLRSHTSGPWCSPDAWLQGHAVWHVLSGASVWLAYEHARRTSP